MQDERQPRGAAGLKVAEDSARSAQRRRLRGDGRHGAAASAGLRGNLPIRARGPGGGSGHDKLLVVLGALWNDKELVTCLDPPEGASPSSTGTETRRSPGARRHTTRSDRPFETLLRGVRTYSRRCCSAGRLERTRARSAGSYSAMATPSPSEHRAVTRPHGSTTMAWPQVMRSFGWRPCCAGATT